MNHITHHLKQFGLMVAAVILITVPTATTLADGCTPPSGGAGVNQPTGSDAGTFTYNCDGQYAGKYTNKYYVYNPADGSRTALYDEDYKYDCSTQKWTMLWWSYSPAQSDFYPSRIGADAPAGQSTNCPVPTQATGSGSTGSASTSGAGGSGSTGNGITNTGTGSTNTTNNNTAINSNVINNNTVYMRNGLVSQATTGNATVTGNTVGGSALTGDALSMANIINLLQSTSNVFGPDIANFVANIDGDVNGDFMFDPAAIIGNTGTNSTNAANNNITVNSNNSNTNTAHINNDINVGADSGDATVAGNTKGGDATSGNATALVTLTNLINSHITAGKSLIGAINISGNLNGDILLPEGFLDQLIASTGTNSNNAVNNNVTSNATTTNTNNLGTTNNVTSSANSGSANVSGNTTGGSATSGAAANKLTILNLSGSNIVGKNNMLVFVNVRGNWVGMIMNAPQGATAASLGGGISTTGTNSQNSVNNNINVNDTTTNTNNQGITNNVNVHAASGDASVKNNTVGGSAKSGNASTDVNITNLNGVNLDLSGIFTMLFINIGKNWTGSFGINTSAGDPVAVATDPSGLSAGSGGNQSAGQPFRFVPNSTVPGATNRDYSVAAGSASGSAGNTSQDGVVLAAAKSAIPTVASAADVASQKSLNHFIVPLVGVGLAFLLLFAGEHKRKITK